MLVKRATVLYHSFKQLGQLIHTYVKYFPSVCTSCAVICFYGYTSVHYNDATMSPMAYQITSIWPLCSTVCPGAHQRKHQTSASLSFVGIHRRSVDSPHKGPVTRKMFPFDDVIMSCVSSYGFTFIVILQLTKFLRLPNTSEATAQNSTSVPVKLLWCGRVWVR